MDVSKVIVRPIISEASLKEVDSNKYVFEVDKNANKRDVAMAIKVKFGVDILKVQTRLIKGRSRRMLKKRTRVKLGPIKKATVRIASDQKIDIFKSK